MGHGGNAQYAEARGAGAGADRSAGAEPAGPQPVARAAQYELDVFDVIRHEAAQVRPRVSGERAVWQDYRSNAGAAIGERANSDIYARELNDNDDKLNTGSNDARRPDIDGDLIVWSQDLGSENLDIVGHDVDDDENFPIT